MTKQTSLPVKRSGLSIADAFSFPLIFIGTYAPLIASFLWYRLYNIQKTLTVSECKATSPTETFGILRKFVNEMSSTVAAAQADVDLALNFIYVCSFITLAAVMRFITDTSKTTPPRTPKKAKAVILGSDTEFMPEDILLILVGSISPFLICRKVESVENAVTANVNVVTALVNDINILQADVATLAAELITFSTSINNLWIAAICYITATVLCISFMLEATDRKLSTQR